MRHGDGHHGWGGRAKASESPKTPQENVLAVQITPLSLTRVQ